MKDGIFLQNYHFFQNVDTHYFFKGAKVRAEIYEAFENIYPILKGFRKTT